MRWKGKANKSTYKYFLKFKKAFVTRIRNVDYLL
jgi:hypothetical protein